MKTKFTVITSLFLFLIGCKISNTEAIKAATVAQDYVMALSAFDLDKAISLSHSQAAPDLNELPQGTSKQDFEMMKNLIATHLDLIEVNITNKEKKDNKYLVTVHVKLKDPLDETQYKENNYLITVAQEDNNDWKVINAESLK